MLNQTIFDVKEGLPIGKGSKSFTYLYGLSDFWAYLFEDFQSVNLLMETNSLTESEIYSNFLQLCSSISVDQIQAYSGSQLKLVILSEKDNIGGNSFQLSKNIVSSKYIANRALLPTISLEQDSDYRVDSNCVITFAKPLASLGFPSRLLPDGTREYALWFIDVRLDESWIYKYYGSLLGVPKPTTISETYKDFVYGMFYLYCNGPNLNLLKKGLNLAMGIPLARDNETVLEIRQYLNTSDYLVITDLNSYVIPYGLQPTVSVGDYVKVGQELSSWVELKDYQSDGDWWVNLRMPPSIVPFGGTGDYASIGSDTDWLMRNYLKTHTFLVNVKTTNFKNVQTFDELFSIIREVKPTYTTPIYIWTISSEDTLEIWEENLSLRPSMYLEDDFVEMMDFCRDAERPYRHFVSNSLFSRMSVPGWVNEFVGVGKEVNGEIDFTYRDTILTGFVTPQLQWRESLGVKEAAWVRALCNYSNSHNLKRRTVANFAKRVPPGLDGTGYDPLADRFPTKRVVFLYNTTAESFKSRAASVGVVVPSEVGTNAQYISTISVLSSTMRNNVSTLLTRDPSITLLNLLEGDASRTFTPSQSDILDGDFLATTFILDGYVGVYWITTNFTAEVTPYWEITSRDELSVKINGNLTMNGGTCSNPLKNLMGVGLPAGQTTYSDQGWPMDFSGTPYIETKTYK